MKKFNFFTCLNIIILQDKVQKPLVGIDWKRYPKELAPSSKKSKSSKRSNAAKVNLNVKRRKANTSVDPDQLLEKLEKNEVQEKDEDGNEGDEKSNAGSDKEDDEASNKDDFDEEEVMDEELGMISHKKSLITIFGHKQIFFSFVIFHEKFQWQ